jgi:hypothetical protein
MNDDILKGAYKAVADALTEFGYNGITPTQIEEAHGRWKRGEDAADVIDMFARREFEEHPRVFGTPDVPKATTVF